MAIIKFLNDLADFAAINGTKTSLAPYFTNTRVQGWVFPANDSMVAQWAAPAGNEIWFHFTLGYSNSSTLWDENDHIRLEDPANTLVVSSDIRDGFIDWNLYGDTTASFTYRNIADALLVHDLHIVKNGTTDLTMTLYINGAFQGTRTVANAADKDLPTNLSMTNLDTNNGGTLYFGECVIADEDTRGWRLYQLTPTAFGVNQEWDGEATSVTDGSLLTGIATDVANERASFGVSRIENIPDDALIDRICIQTYGQRGETGLTSFNHYFRYEDTTIEDDADLVLAQTVGLFLDEYATDPKTVLPWTTAGIQGLQIGVRART